VNDLTPRLEQLAELVGRLPAAPAPSWTPTPGAIAIHASATLTDHDRDELERISRTAIEGVGLTVGGLQSITTGNRSADGRVTRLLVFDVGGTDRTWRGWPVHEVEAAIRAAGLRYPLAVQAHPSGPDLETWRLRRKGLMPDGSMTPERGSE
jgi:hypothetical protein